MKTEYNQGDLVEIDSFGTDDNKRIGIILGKLKPMEVRLNKSPFTYNKFLPEYEVLCNEKRLCYSYVFLKPFKINKQEKKD